MGDYEGKSRQTYSGRYCIGIQGARLTFHMVGFLVVLFGFYDSSSISPERSMKRGAILFDVCLNISTPPALVTIPRVSYATTSSSNSCGITNRHPRKNM